MPGPASSYESVRLLRERDRERKDRCVHESAIIRVREWNSVRGSRGGDRELMMMEAQRAQRRSGKTLQGVKTKSRLCHSPHGLPSCWATTNCSHKGKKKKQNNLLTIPPHCSPTQTHKHTYNTHSLTAALPAPSFPNSEWTYRSDVRGGGAAWHKYHKFCCLCIDHSSGLPRMQLHPSPRDTNIQTIHDISDVLKGVHSKCKSIVRNECLTYAI